MRRSFRRVLPHAGDRGASAVEYGLLIAAIAAVIVGVVFVLGSYLPAGFQDTCTEMEQHNPLTTPDSADC